MKIELVPVTKDRLDQIADNMNPRDADEILASGGFTPHQGLHIAALVSDECMVAQIGYEYVSAFGIARIDENTASPWMLSTPTLFRLRKQFMAVSRAVVARWRKHYPLLYNHIDARNVTSIKWLEALGFAMTERIDRFGVAQIPFYRFEMKS